MVRIFIDDTGSPGVVSESLYDSTDAKTWVALILSEKQYTDARLEMTELLKELETTEASEFHFKDILQGTNEFRNMPLEERLEILVYFADFYRNFQFPLLVQTLASDDYLRNKIIIENHKLKRDNFRANNNGDLALICLMMRIKSYLKTNRLEDEEIFITIDSGRQKGGTYQNCSLFGKQLVGGTLKYEQSHFEPMLQLVDFVAFMINKQRLILTKTEKSGLDQTLRVIFARAQFNALNMIKMYVPIDADTVKINDQLLRQRFAQTNRDLPDITLSELIEQYYR